MDSPQGPKELDRTEWLAFSLSLSCCGAHALGRLGFSSCSPWALERRLHSRGKDRLSCSAACGVFPGKIFSGIEPVSCIGDGFFFLFLTTDPPGKPRSSFIFTEKLQRVQRVSMYPTPSLCYYYFTLV